MSVARYVGESRDACQTRLFIPPRFRGGWSRAIASGRVGRRYHDPTRLRASRGATLPFQGRDKKSRHAKSPLLFDGAGFAGLPFSVPSSLRISGKPDMRYEGCGAPRGAAVILPCRAPFGARAPLGAPRSGVLRRPGRAFGGFLPALAPGPADPFRSIGAFRASGEAIARAVSQLLAGGPCASGRSPGAARARRIRCPSPAGAAAYPTSRTPLEAPLIGRAKGL